uniref:C2H2-type domain-containing protein n=1 Tax=Clastoptera arizonana TaxID=38151 RepID=A0A1B6DUM5_9HEMI
MGCGVCGIDHAVETCNILGPFFPIYDPPSIPLARISLPPGLLIKELIDGTKTVVATKMFLRGVRFGPFKATCTTTLAPNISFPLKIFHEDEDPVFLKTDEEEYSNWMCFVTAATCLEDLNMYCYQMEENIYFSVISDISPGSELKVWYAPFYAKLMKAELLRSSYPESETYSEVDTNIMANHNVNQLVHNYDKKRKKKRILKINCQISDSIKNKLPAELMGAVKPLQEWKCKFCNFVDDNVSAYAKHHIQHLKINRLKCCCKDRKIGIHHTRCRLFDKKLQTKQVPEMSEEKNQSIPNEQEPVSNNALSDVTNLPNSQSIQDKNSDLQTNETKNCDNLLLSSDKDGDFNLNFEIISKMSVLDFLGKQICFNDNNVTINNVINDNLVPLTDNNSSLKEGLDPPLLDLNDEIEFNNLKTFDSIETNISRNESCPDLLDNVVSNLLCSVENNTEQLDIYDIDDKTDFVGQKFDNLIEVTDEDKNRLVENLLQDVSVNENFEKEQLNQMPVEENSLKESENQLKSFECDICKKFFSKESYLERHLRKHTGEFSCKYCMNVFARKETLLTHMCPSNSYPPETYRKERCNICSEWFYSSNELHSHVAIHHCTYSKWECRYCHASGDTDNINTHLCAQSDGLEKQFSCDNCKKTYKSVVEFIDHRKEINVFKVKILHGRKMLCHICGMLKSRKAFHLHLKIHGGKQFECNECGAKFSRKDTLEQHLFKHKPNHQFECNKCNKKFSMMKKLKKHMVTHSNRSKHISCQHCDKVFFYKNSMVVHMESHFKKFTCDKCNLEFSSKLTLNNHMVRHLNNIFKCTICDCKFYSEKQLKSHHLFKHSSIYYKCLYCQTKLQYRQSLKRHLNSRHPDSKDEWNTKDYIDSMKINSIGNEKSVETAETSQITSKKQMLEVNEISEIINTSQESAKVKTKEQLLDVLNSSILEQMSKRDILSLFEANNLQETYHQDLVPNVNECSLGMNNDASNIREFNNGENLVELISLSGIEMKNLDILNGTTNNEESNAQDLLILKDRLTDPVNTTSQAITDSSLLGLVNSNPSLSTPVIQLNMENGTVLWASIGNEEVESLDPTYNTTPVNHTTESEELDCSNEEGVCIDSGNTFLLEDGRIILLYEHLGGGVSHYVLGQTSEDQDLPLL